VDESSVEILHIVSGPDSMARNSHVDSYRYPKAGMTWFLYLSLRQRNEPISTSCAPGWALSLFVDFTHVMGLVQRLSKEGST